MSCLNSALTRCHKLIQLSVTTSGAFAPVFLLYSSNHFMVSYKSHHMLIYQPFLPCPGGSARCSYQFSVGLLHSFAALASDPTALSVLPVSGSWGWLNQTCNSRGSGILPKFPSPTDGLFPSAAASLNLPGRTLVKKPCIQTSITKGSNTHPMCHDRFHVLIQNLYCLCIHGVIGNFHLGICKGHLQRKSSLHYPVFLSHGAERLHLPLWYPERSVPWCPS